MKIDLKKWKKVGQEEGFSTFSNDQGHQLRIAHKGLHPATRGQMAALPLYDGGMVDKQLPTSNLPEGYRDPKSQALQDPEVTGADMVMAASSLPLAKAGRSAALPAASALMADEAGYLGTRGAPKILPRGANAIQKAKDAAAAAAPADMAKAQQKVNRAIDMAERTANQLKARKRGNYAKGGEVQDVDLNDAPQEPIQDVDLDTQGVQDINADGSPIMPAPEASAIQDMDLNRMPASEAGVAEMSDSAAPQSDPNQPPLDRRSQIIKELAGFLETQHPKIPAPDLPSVQKSATAPAGPKEPDQTKIMQGAMGMEQAGMRDEAKALGQQGLDQQKAINDRLQLDQAANQEYAKHFQEIEAERKALTEDIKNGHIDPTRFVDNMSTSSRIQTAIGLIASGMGSAMAGQENLAAKFFEKQIENDIQAQKANLGVKETLLSANLKRFGSMNEAANMYRMQRSDMLSSQMMDAAAKAQGPLAKARLQQAAGELQLKYAPLQAKLAQQKTLAALTAGLQQDPSKGQEVINYIAQIDPEHAKDLRERFVPGVGLANSSSDAKHLMEVGASATNTRKGIQDLLAIASIPGASVSMETRKKAQVTATLLMGALNKQVTGGGPMSAQEQEMVRGIVADPTRIFSLDNSNRTALKTLMKRTNDWEASESTARGVKPRDPATSLAPEQQAWVQWARSHPNDPKAKAVLQKLGIE